MTLHKISYSETIEKDGQVILRDTQESFPLTEPKDVQIALNPLNKAIQQKLVTISTFHDEDGRRGLRISRILGSGADEGFDKGEYKYGSENREAIYNFMTETFIGAGDMALKRELSGFSKNVDAIEITNPVTLASFKKAGLEVDGLDALTIDYGKHEYHGTLVGRQIEKQ